MESVAIAAILFVAAALQAFLGFGYGIVAMALLTLVVGVLPASGIVNATGLVLTGSVAFVLRRHIRWSLVWRVAAGTLAGVPLGVWLLDRLDLVLAQRLLGVTITAIALWNLSSSRPSGEPARGWDVPVGLCSGVLSGLFNTGGPPVIAHLLRHRGEPDAIRATIQVLLLWPGLVRLPSAAYAGLLTREVWIHATLGLAFVVAGMWCGLRLRNLVDAERFRRLSWMALVALGIWIAALA